MPAFPPLTEDCAEVPGIEVPDSIGDNCDEAPRLTFDETTEPG